MIEQKIDSSSPKYLTIKQWVKTYGFIPEGGIRHLIFTNPEFNKRVVRRIGKKKIVLDVQALFDFIEKENPKKEVINEIA